MSVWPAEPDRRHGPLPEEDHRPDHLPLRAGRDGGGTVLPTSPPPPQPRPTHPGPALSSLAQQVVFIFFGHARPVATASAMVSHTEPYFRCAACGGAAKMVGISCAGLDCSGLCAALTAVLVLQVCSGCRAVHYCSPACQRHHWIPHRKYCRQNRD